MATMAAIVSRKRGWGKISVFLDCVNFGLYIYITATEGPTTAAIKLTKIVKSIFPEVDCLFRKGVSQQMKLIVLKY